MNKTEAPTRLVDVHPEEIAFSMTRELFNKMIVQIMPTGLWGVGFCSWDYLRPNIAKFVEERRTPTLGVADANT